MATARTPAEGAWGWQRAQRLARYLITGCFLVGVAPALAAQVTVSQVLGVRPKQDGVNCTTPAAAEVKDCKLEPTKGGRGWVLKDGAGTVLRHFADSNGDGHVDTWSFYKDGVEVYRETDSTFGGKGKADNFRWLNGGGSKWGVDQNKDGVIDTWKVISPEEVSQEVVRALATRDLRRLQALLITDAEVKALGLPAAQAERIGKLRQGVPAKFQAAVAKLPKLNDQARWLHLETSAPECVPAEQIGARLDVIRHPRGTALVEMADKSTDWVQTGEMIQVGAAWRLVDAPVAGASVPGGSIGEKDDAQIKTDDPRVQKLVEQLSELDKKAPAATSGPEVVRHHVARADLLEQIVAAVQPEGRDPFIRQVADSLSAAVQAGTTLDAPAAKRLASLEQQLTQHMRGAGLTAYVAFRKLQAENWVKTSAPGAKFEEVQQELLKGLAAFIEAYPRAEDTPDAMLNAGTASELINKEVEAKNWYQKLAKTFPDKPQAAKALGAVRRLELEGKPIKLAGPRLEDANVTYDVDQMKGKLVIVYYWASWNANGAADLAKLKAIRAAYPNQVDLLGINLDATPEVAREFLRRNPGPGTHLYQKGGLDGKLATSYGIMALPSVFLVGKDGKVLSRNAQVSTLEDEVKKHLKK
jgi:hypothetical protein